MVRNVFRLDERQIGSMMIPAMKKEGYKPAFAVAVTACASMMAPIIPPSIIHFKYRWHFP